MTGRRPLAGDPPGDPPGGGGAPGQQAAHTLHKIELLVEAGQFASAAALAGAFLASCPDDPDALVALGKAQRGLGRGPDAAESFGRALAANPAHYPAGCCLAFELSRAGDHGGALAAARNLVRMHPEVWGSHFTLASVALECPNPALRQEAYAAAYRAVQLEPGESSNHVVLGLAARALGDIASARRANEEALRLDPDNAAALNNRGTVMRASHGGWTEQVETYARSAAVDPHDSVARYNLEVSAFNAVARGRWVEFAAVLVAVLGAAVGGAAHDLVAVVLAMVAVTVIWVVWAARAYRRIPRGRRALLARVARQSGPVRAIMISTAVLAVVSVAVIPLALVLPVSGLPVLVVLMLHRIVEIAALSSLRGRHPNR